MDLVYRIAAFVLTCSTFLPVAAAHPRGASAPYSVSVRDERGRELPTFHHAGQTFVLGTFGARYTVQVDNRTARRIEAVVSVDGRDVISGRVGDYVGQRGYLIDAYDRVVIEGFRRDWDEVAAFRFTSPQGSYSARMGTPENVGVIGVAIFPERAREVIARRAPRSSRRGAGASGNDGLGASSRVEAREAPSADAAGEASAAAGTRTGKGSRHEGAAAPQTNTDNLGTKYGESLSSSVREVPFRRANASQPEAVIALRYDDRSGLLARGIALEPRRTRPHRTCGPQAFPNSRFAPPPPPYCQR